MQQAASGGWLVKQQPGRVTRRVSGLYLRHEEAGFSVQQLALGSRIEQEGVTTEGEGPIQAKLVLGWSWVCLQAT